jgi:iron(III) transport system substrate-binding protein
VLVSACQAGRLPAPAAPPAAPAAQTAGGGSPEWQQVLEAARKEGAVSVYAGSGQPNREALVEPFERAYPGIKINLTVTPPRDLVPKLSAERTASKYLADILLGAGASALVPLKPVGALVPLESSLLLPEVRDTAAWLDNQHWWLDTTEPRTTIGYVGNVQPPIAYNRQMVDPGEFRSYFDLLNPKWKGKIVATDVRSPGVGSVPTRYMYKHPDLGPPFLERLFGEMDITLSADQRQLTDWLAQGAYPLGLLMLSADFIGAMNQGLPIDVAPGEQLKEGVPIGPAGGAVSIMDKAPNPNAAKVFVNWLLSKDGQIAWQTHVKDNSLRMDIPKEGISRIYLPKPGVRYVNAATEDYAKLSSTEIAELITKALEKGGR